MTRAVAAVVATIVLAACAAESRPRSDARQSASTEPAPATSTSSSPAPSPSISRPPVEPSGVLLRFAVIGDFGTASRTQRDVAARMCKWRRNHPFDLVFTTGDNIYDVGDPDDFQEKFFDPYACLLDNGVRFRAALGNHDIRTDNGQPELDEPAFGMKGRNYVVRKNGVRFVIADSNYMNKTWLRRATAARPGDLWTIVLFHHPVYSAGTHGSTPAFKPDLPRIFRRRDVDLVLNGHDHLYAVTKPLREIRYVVTGGGGAGLYACSDPWFSATCRKRHHFSYVVVTPDRITLRAVPSRGRPFHRFTTRGRS